MQNNYKIETQKYEFTRDLSALGNPILLLLLSILFVDSYTSFFMLLVGLILLEITGNIIKLVFFKSRPLKHEYKNIFEKALASSFPSLHVARFTFFATFFLTTIDASFVSALILISFLAYSRLYLKKHDLIDVIGGLFLGLLFIALIQLVY